MLEPLSKLLKEVRRATILRDHLDSGIIKLCRRVLTVARMCIHPSALPMGTAATITALVCSEGASCACCAGRSAALDSAEQVRRGRRIYALTPVNPEACRSESDISLRGSKYPMFNV